MAPKNHQNHYEILSPPETCTAEEVNRRYKVLSMRHHPDKGGDADVMATINHARDVLTDLTAREAFHRATCRPPLRGFRPSPRPASGDSPFERTTFGPAPQSAPPVPQRRGTYAPKSHSEIEHAEQPQREPTPPPESRPLKRAGARRARPAPPPGMRAEAGGAEPCAQPVMEKERDDWWEGLVKDWDFDRPLTKEEKALADPEIQEMWSKWFE